MRICLTLLFFVVTTFSVSQNTVCFTIEANPNSTDPALGGFTKYIKVLNCFEIYAEPTLSDAQVLHAAAIAAELLDNNEDGIVDDSNVYNELAASQAIMPMFSVEGSAAEIAFMDNYTGDGASAVLYADEVDPNNPGVWGSDATVEEILHTINHRGQVSVYPTAFDIIPNSSMMSAAMDSARGGQFITIPNPYPSDSWYHYDDQTCDYECMAIEYMYWSIVANMGLLDEAGICSGIANEWELCTQSLFQSTDVLMYALITDQQYKIPQNAPDGNYCVVSSHIDYSEHEVNIRFYPNPAKDVLFVIDEINTPLVIYNSIGQRVLCTRDQEIDISLLAAGIYVLEANGRRQKFEIQE